MIKYPKNRKSWYKPIEDRFIGKVKKNKGSTCLIWMGTQNKKHGYGIIQVTNPTSKKRKVLLAHRVAYAINVGPIPDGLCVLHTCDIRLCINPKHLWIGTKGDNARDAARKGRNSMQRRQYCPKGHPLKGKNLVKKKNHNRQCKTCKNAHDRNAYHSESPSKRAKRLHKIKLWKRQWRAKIKAGAK